MSAGNRAPTLRLVRDEETPASVSQANHSLDALIGDLAKRFNDLPQGTCRVSARVLIREYGCANGYKTVNH